jgi:hypothetical protein
MKPGALPQAVMNAAPLALNTSKPGVSERFTGRTYISTLRTTSISVVAKTFRARAILRAN